MAKAPDDRVEKDDKTSAWPEPDSTVRILAVSLEAAAMAVLRGAYTLRPGSTRPAELRSESDLAPRTDTPKTLVVSAVVRADRGTLTVIAGPEAGATFSLVDDETIVGRGPPASILLNDPSVSRQHARISRDDRAHHYIEDLGSTNGTFVDGRRVRRASLSSGDRVQLGRDSVFRFAVVDREEEEVQRRLYQASMLDGLTDLPNRRSLLDRLAGQIAHVRRSGGELGLLMIDLDHFKEINDKVGHLAGDEVLRQTAQVGAQVVRAGDVFARYGGEEFVVVARQGKAEAIAMAERLRTSIMDMRLDVGGRAIGVTVSIGVAVLSECNDTDDGTQLLGLADARLYMAKISGRNRACAEG